ncbi:hypothetical protein P153DRAFT_392017 [Dothidotthia symphoricarpi CBS 119687]|uniref:Uncharacterized protein n=1 Tax=Dothidotthia symphoricarpi CBS 119687 TaxID=1392245 RepID=A0A6A6AU09_9PLEO|nr:uncharacterized protein P153DRAFT_392017 [Dothidotthia symphoricarpi CBS 119687]KAF2134693.1 hypothetical protein P153DRAFT_392017 [Dothidotthia symphoricarpi CBS 119687]
MEHLPLQETELRERSVGGLSKELSPNPPTTPISLALCPISEQEAKDKSLPALKSLPLILRTPFICSALVFNLLVLGLLISLLFYDYFSFSNRWSYLAIQILPPVLGTITASLWHAIAVNLSRMTPFMLAAEPEGSAFGKTILGAYFPGLSLRNAIANGNGLLAFVWILEIISATILSFKSSLLNTANYDDYVEAVVTPWALYSLIVIYALMCVLMGILTCRLYDLVTGLRWEPASIADHLALFRHSDFLDKFEGTDTAERDSLWDRLQNDHLKLGRIQATKAIPAPSDSDGQEQQPQRTGVQGTQKASQPPATKKFSLRDIADTRYRSVALNMEHWMAYIWISLTLTLLAASITGLAIGLVGGQTTSMSYNWATVVFQFIPAFSVSLYTWFWQDVDLFARSTQPFRGMSSPKPASENLLLDYNTLPPFVVTFVALKNGHKRIAWTSVVAIVQRLLPVLTAGSTTVVPGDESGSIVYASMPLFICITIWLALYCFLIPLEVFGRKLPQHYVKRHLPRSYSSISDLISWAYASKLLRSDDGDPFDFPISGPKNERWYMEARLRLKLNHDRSEFATYSFGLYESVKHKGVMCMGFDVASNAVTIPCGRRVSKEGKEDVEATQEFTVMLAPKDSKHVLGATRERPTDLKTLAEQQPPHQAEEEEPQTEAI